MLRRVACETMSVLKLHHHCTGVAAVREGPRMETPAEVRMLGATGAQIVTHHFVPEAFLAKELELCYAAVCYAVNYAETGSKHRPFASGESSRLLAAQRPRKAQLHAGQHGTVPAQLAIAVAAAAKECECSQTMAKRERLRPER